MNAEHSDGKPTMVPVYMRMHDKVFVLQADLKIIQTVKRYGDFQCIVR